MKHEKCSQEYEKTCECREDDNCGCTYPNNMHNDFMCADFYMKKSSAKVAADAEKAFNQAEGEGTFVCPLCQTSEKDCACKKED